MSKSKKNYPSLEKVFECYGADAIRFLLIGSVATQAEPMKVAEKDIQEVVRCIQIPLLHLFKLFATQANKINFHAEKSCEVLLSLENSLDQWLFYRIELFKENMKNFYDHYNLVKACDEIRSFIDEFSRYYIRNCKIRFTTKNLKDQVEALQTMHHALDTLSHCIAPIMPFMADHIYRELYGKTQSIHLQYWPHPISSHSYAKAFRELELVKTIIKLGNTIRQEKESKIEFIQPLASAILSQELYATLEPHQVLLKSALNVEKINWVENEAKDILTVQIRLHENKLGPKYKTELRLIKEAIKEGSYTLEENSLRIHCKNSKIFLLHPEEFAVDYLPRKNISGAVAGNLWLALDMQLTPELIEKSVVRKIQHQIQALRKECHLTYHDRISVFFTGNEALKQLLRRYRKQLSTHTKADIFFSNEFNNIDPVPGSTLPAVVADIQLDSFQGKISIVKVDSALHIAPENEVSIATSSPDTQAVANNRSNLFYHSVLPTAAHSNDAVSEQKLNFN